MRHPSLNFVVILKVMNVQMCKYLHWRSWNTRWTIHWIAYALRLGAFRTLLHRLLLLNDHK